MPSDDGHMINQAAKELFGVFMYTTAQSRIDREWAKLSDTAKAAWIRVAEHAVKSSVELLGVLTTPDHR